MILRFEVDQAKAFRRGINVPKSTCHLDVDPSALDQNVRDLIADRLDGIDVCFLQVSGRDIYKMSPAPGSVYHRIVADGPNFEDLMDAIFKNHAEVTAQIEKAKPQPVIKSRL